MARIFLKDPPLLAMQGIDPGEVNFGQTSDGQAKPSADGFARLALAEDRLIKGRTTVIVARRLSTTLDADHIIVLRGACIKEQGKHSELYDSNGYYRLLCESEFGRY